MRKLIASTLFVGASLLSLLPAASPAFAQDISSFIQLKRNEQGDPAALQTSIVTYVPANGAGDIEVALVSAVHIGDRSYYEQLNELFPNYAAVLYELVAEKGAKPSQGGEGVSSNPLAILHTLMKLVLQLEHQLEVVNYSASNFVHADLSPDQLMEELRKRGKDPIVVILEVIKDLLDKMKDGAKDPTSQIPKITFEDVLEALENPIKLKRLFAEELVKARGDTGFGKIFDDVVIVARNKAALEVLTEQLAQTKKGEKIRIAIFYGAAHMPDFDKHLTGDFGLTRTTTDWVTAWKLE